MSAKSFALDLFQVTLPRLDLCITPQQPLLVQRIEELGKEKRVALGAFTNEVCERLAGCGRRMQCVGHQLVQIHGRNGASWMSTTGVPLW